MSHKGGRGQILPGPRPGEEELGHHEDKIEVQHGAVRASTTFKPILDSILWGGGCSCLSYQFLRPFSNFRLRF